MPSKYTNYTKEELIEEQANLEVITGEQINGALGGLPVVEQSQEFFAVFDEAGSTGPEIIDKTQFRISYLVDSQLNTSKPVDDTPAAFNTTQNFGKAEECVVRADNATVLNQNLTGKQSIYDVGTLALISTTEYGKNNDEYITTMSFNTVGGQTVGEAQNLSSRFRQRPSVFENKVTGNNDDLICRFPTTITPISQSSTTWLSFNDERYLFGQDTTLAGTRVNIVSNVTMKISGVEFQKNTSGLYEIIYEPAGGGADEILGAGGTSIQGTEYNSDLNQGSIGFSIQSGFRNFSAQDQIRFRLTKTGTSLASTVELTNAFVNTVQETPAGDVLIIGVNACTSSYWSGFQTVGNSSNVEDNYSILTASVDFSTFLEGQHIQRMNTASAAFDPENDGNVFNPIQTPLTFLPGDEIRFTYNKNKVHKVIRAENEDDGLKLYIHPAVDTVELNVIGSNGTQLNHFTHYRIIPNGGYLIIDKKKDNQAGVSQDFKGIITPQNPSKLLDEKGDELIYELKQAGIIET